MEEGGIVSVSGEAGKVYDGIYMKRYHGALVACVILMVGILLCAGLSSAIPEPQVAVSDTMVLMIGKLTQLLTTVITLLIACSCIMIYLAVAARKAQVRAGKEPDTVSIPNISNLPGVAVCVVVSDICNMLVGKVDLAEDALQIFKFCSNDGLASALIIATGMAAFAGSLTGLCGIHSSIESGDQIKGETVVSQTNQQ